MKTQFNSRIRPISHSFCGAICAGAILLAASSTPAQNNYAPTYNYTTIDAPSATGGTTPLGIDGNSVVGYYQNSSGVFGFLYNGNNYATLAFPSSADTIAAGISGNTIVGYYNQNGFLYNISTASYTMLNNPAGANGITPNGISGNNIVGTYWYGSGGNGAGGFLYNISTASYTLLNVPSSIQTFASGIDGNNIVGSYYSSSDQYCGFLYNISTDTYTTLNDPLGFGGTEAMGISGNNIVGHYFDSHNRYYGFLYNISTDTYTTLTDPLGVYGTGATAISGNTIVGYYSPYSGYYTGFEAIPVPEPTVLALAGLGVVSLFSFGRKSKG
jgi:hypothetical protein